VSEYTTDETDNYLTMARVAESEWHKWKKEHIQANDTGHTMLRANLAFRDAFFKGFCFKFTGEDS
jgi:hypothetical protein